MECSGTDRDPHHYLARGHVRGNRRGHVGAEDVVCADEGGPGGLTYRAGTAGTGRCGGWLETIHLGSWRRCAADREAGLDLWVHTVQTVTMDKEEEKGRTRYQVRENGGQYDLKNESDMQPTRSSSHRFTALTDSVMET